MVVVVVGSVRSFSRGLVDFFVHGRNANTACGETVHSQVKNVVRGRHYEKKLCLTTEIRLCWTPCLPKVGRQTQHDPG